MTRTQTLQLLLLLLLSITKGSKLTQTFIERKRTKNLKKWKKLLYFFFCQQLLEPLFNSTKFRRAPCLRRDQDCFVEFQPCRIYTFCRLLVEFSFLLNLERIKLAPPFPRQNGSFCRIYIFCGLGRILSKF